MRVEIRKLDKASLAGRTDRFAYESEGTYRVKVARTPDGWDLSLRKERFPEMFVKNLDEPLLTHYKGDSEVFGAFVDGVEAGLIQIEHQSWNRSLRVWDISVEEGHRRRGVGTALVGIAQKRARELGARRIVLETQTSNLKAIAFYESCGFALVGLDATNYTNDDVGKGEVRLEMAWYPGA